MNKEQNMARQSYSIVEYYGEQDGYKCGYCKSPNTNFSHGKYQSMQQISIMNFYFKIFYLYMQYFILLLIGYVVSMIISYMYNFCSCHAKFHLLMRQCYLNNMSCIASLS